MIQFQRSRRVYAWLLQLYPHEHRQTFGADMLQVFTDQLRDTRPGLLRLVIFWLRTLVDLGASALREHVTAPNANLGLLEAVPNTPLPWKGVALVLFPGLVFFIGQVAQLNGEDWFFWLVYRGAYVLILPVLVVWIWKRKFPIWGLVPLGLFVKTLLYLGYRVQFLGLSDTNPLWHMLIALINQTSGTMMRGSVGVLLLLIILGLLWAAARRGAVTRRGWIWLGITAALIGVDFLANAIIFYRGVSPLELSNENLLNALFDNTFYEIYTLCGFVVLILVGTLLARRHGLLTVLLPLGYLLPTVLYGRISNEWPDPATPAYTLMLWVSISALTYRFLVALACPVWIVRSASGQMQKRAGAVSFAVLVAIQMGFNLAMYFSSGFSINILQYVLIGVVEQLIYAAGLALSVALYQAAPAAQSKPKAVIVRGNVTTPTD
jgi:hypothetical protein